jgi:hypothetical protein
MTKRMLLCAVASCAAVLVSGSSAFAKDNWIGTWKLDVAKSKFDPAPGLQSQTIKFEPAADGAIHLVGDSVNAEGKAMHTEYTSKFDGKGVAWTGNPNADTATAKRIDANRYENVWKKDGKATIHSKVKVSADGKTLTITQTGKDASGKAVNTVLVFDRQ